MCPVQCSECRQVHRYDCYSTNHSTAEGKYGGCQEERGEEVTVQRDGRTGGRTDGQVSGGNTQHTGDSMLCTRHCGANIGTNLGSPGVQQLHSMGRMNRKNTRMVKTGRQSVRQQKERMVDTKQPHSHNESRPSLCPAVCLSVCPAGYRRTAGGSDYIDSLLQLTVEYVTTTARH